MEHHNRSFIVDNDGNCAVENNYSKKEAGKNVDDDYIKKEAGKNWHEKKPSLGKEIFIKGVQKELWKQISKNLKF